MGLSPRTQVLVTKASVLPSAGWEWAWAMLPLTFFSPLAGLTLSPSPWPLSREEEKAGPCLLGTEASDA